MPEVEQPNDRAYDAIKRAQAKSSTELRFQILLSEGHLEKVQNFEAIFRVRQECWAREIVGPEARRALEREGQLDGVQAAAVVKLNGHLADQHVHVLGLVAWNRKHITD